MSDFLGNLISRSLNLPANRTGGKILQPRLPSLFEAPNDKMAAVPTAASLETNLTSGTDVERPMDLLKSLGDGARPDIGLSDFPTEIPTGPSFPPERSPAREPVAVPGFHRSPRENLEWTDRPTGETQGRRAVEPRLSVAYEIHDIPAVSSTAIEPNQTPIAEQTIPERSAAEKSALRESRSIHPSIEPYRPKGEVPIPIPMSAGRLCSMEDPTFGPYEQNQKETASPVVRIHIGRIDVRAVASSPLPVRKPAPYRPKLSLDEYLRQRDEGKR